MLALRMSKVFIYVVVRDFGFAPNPFHGTCTLATCKPEIRKAAISGDWVIGMGGSRLNATGKCIFMMRVSKKVSFSDYWSAPEFRDKIPVRNGSRRMMVGDNVYNRVGGQWVQADSHHSNADGSPNLDNLKRDTRVDAVLISSCFYYFGRSAPPVPPQLLKKMGYKNIRSHRVFPSDSSASNFVQWVESQFANARNRVSADPFDFDRSSARYSASTDRLYDASVAGSVQL
jgi:hypothetical protein